MKGNILSLLVTAHSFLVHRVLFIVVVFPVMFGFVFSSGLAEQCEGWRCGGAGYLSLIRLSWGR